MEGSTPRKEIHYVFWSVGGIRSCVARHVYVFEIVSGAEVAMQAAVWLAYR